MSRTKKDYYRSMKVIRSFEEMILELFEKNELSGTTHTCIGQEAVAVAAMSDLQEGDIVFSNHRCHGHYLAYGGTVEGLLAEIMTREGGLCGGRGGSQHIHYKRFFSNGIQGGIVPNATGMAWAEKIKGTDNIGIVFIGDGTLGQGIVYETMNMAALLEIPILYVVENNQYAMTTKVCDGVSGDIVKRPQAFGITTYYSASKDVEELRHLFFNAKKEVRSEKKPICVVVDTYRLAAHSKGEDTRDPNEIQMKRLQDPLMLLERELPDEDVALINDEVQHLLQCTLESVKQMDMAELQSKKNLQPCGKYEKVISERGKRCVEEINDALKKFLSVEENAYILGEDICDPYGGAFKVTKGLSEIFPERIINMPISEAGFTGMAVGLAMNGMLPIVELMFGDFATLSFDQILNHAVKYQWIYGDAVKVPFVLRAPMGGGRGYGPTHSQSLEKHFLGIPGLEIMALSPVHNVFELYLYALKKRTSPLMIIENKRLYAEPLYEMKGNKIEHFSVRALFNDIYPTVYMTLDDSNAPDIIALTYGDVVREVMQASLDLMIEDEIQMDILVISQLHPVPINDIMSVVENNARIITIEEGTMDAGWGSEIIAQVATRKSGMIFGKVAAENEPVANGRILEQRQSVNCDRIKAKARGMMDEN